MQSMMMIRRVTLSLSSSRVSSSRLVPPFTPFTQKLYYSKQLTGIPPEQVADWEPKQVAKWLEENVPDIEPATIEAFQMQDVSGYYLRRLSPNKLFRVITGQDPNKDNIHDIITETLLFTTEDYTMRKK